MKKNIIFFLLGGLIFSVISVSASTIYKANQISYTPKDSNWNVSDVEGALEKLYSNINGGKAAIIEALNNKGIIINSNASLEEISSNINNSTGFYKLISLGQITSPGWVHETRTMTIDIKEYYDNYNELTSDNFIGIPGNYTTGAQFDQYSRGSGYFSKSYNADTGILSISRFQGNTNYSPFLGDITIYPYLYVSI